MIEHIPDAPEPVPAHIAIIMDGNGRWARARGLPRLAGHQAGVEAARRTVEAASEAGIRHLTLYSFSTENWKRPPQEVAALMDLLHQFVDRDLSTLIERGVRVRILGNRTGLDARLVRVIERAETRSAHNVDFHLNIAFNYGSRNEITRAVQMIAQDVVEGRTTVEDITEHDVAARLDTADQPAPDLLIRTSGEFRLSNFLLWQLAYAELWFTDILWPDFGGEALHAALKSFAARERRYGALYPAVDEQ